MERMVSGPHSSNQIRGGSGGEMTRLLFDKSINNSQGAVVARNLGQSFISSSMETLSYVGDETPKSDLCLPCGK